MSFSSKRGRPRKPEAVPDFGTPELRLKHALGVTSEPIDLCLARRIITVEQHRSGLHLRWLHTLRYGAPHITTRYTLEDAPPPSPDDPIWRSQREHEYADAVMLLRSHRRHDAVMRLTVLNEMPPFLNPDILRQAWQHPSLEVKLVRERQHLHEGLMLLVDHWKP